MTYISSLGKEFGGYGVTFGGQLTGSSINAYGIAHPEGNYGSTSQILNSFGLGLTLTDGFVGAASVFALSTDAYEATGLALARVGGAFAVATDLAGIGFGLVDGATTGNYFQAYQSTYAFGFGVVGGIIGALAGPEGIPIGYAIGSFLGGFVGEDVAAQQGYKPEEGISSAPGGEANGSDGDFTVDGQPTRPMGGSVMFLTHMTCPVRDTPPS